MISSSRFLSLLLLPLSGLACAPELPPEEPAPAPAPVQEKEEVAKWVPGPSAQEIQRVIRRRDAELRQCYLAGTFKNSQLAGTVKVLFTIDTEGKVSRTSDAGSDIDDPDVVSCVLGVFGNLDFEKGGSSDTEVEYPVVFGRNS